MVKESEPSKIETEKQCQLTESGLQKLKSTICEMSSKLPKGKKAYINKKGDFNILAIAETANADQSIDRDTITKILKTGKPVNSSSITRLAKWAGVELVQNKHYSCQIYRHQPKKKQKDTSSGFVGRETAFSDLDKFVSQGSKIILVWGEGGVGKTELAFHYLRASGYKKILKLLMAKETEDVSSAQVEVSGWLKEVFEVEPSQDFKENLSKLYKLLKGDEKFGIVIDNLEPALNENGKFTARNRSYIELLRALADQDLNSITFITSRQLLSEPSIKFSGYKLQGLGLEAWAEFFEISSDDPNGFQALSEICDAYNGNALAMGIFKGLINNEYEYSIRSCWDYYQNKLLSNQTLDNLVNEQFLCLAYKDKIAYNLLCQMGCLRYQNVPSISVEGLQYILWGKSEEVHKIIENLKNHSLVEFRKGKYWLHPLIRAKSIEKITGTEEWETTNRRFAEYFSSSFSPIKTSSEAKTVLESIYHYKVTESYTDATITLVKDRESPYENTESLGVALYRLGLLSLAMDIIRELIPKIGSDYLLCRLHNLFGEFLSMTGNFSEAIFHYKESRKIAISNLEESPNPEISIDPRRNYKNLNVASYYNIGLAYLDCAEVEKAKDELEYVKTIENQTAIFKSYILGSKFLSDIYCPILMGLKLSTETLELFDWFAEKFRNKDTEGCIDFNNPWAFGYFGNTIGTILLHLKEYDNAEKQFNFVANRMEEIGYIQFQALAINGLAVLNRVRNNFALCRAKHDEAIKLLERTECQRDLAIVYLEYAIFLKESKDIEANVYFERASAIFKKLKIEKLHEKVMRLRK